MSNSRITRVSLSRQNTLKDFIDVAGPLGVTHFLMLSQTEHNVMLRIARAPRGPTLTFRVDAYSLSSSVRALAKQSPDLVTAFETPPLVVLHNFSSVSGAAATATAGVGLADALRMTMVTFQAMFPSIDPAAVRLAACRRVVLVHYHPPATATTGAEGDAAATPAATATAAGPGRIEVRHYYVRAVPVGLSRGVGKVVASKALPDLGGLHDIADFVLGERAGGAGASDSEGEDALGAAAGRVTLPSAFGGRGNVASQQSAIHLTEIGPRLTLTLVKIEAGMAAGEVLYHAFVAKTAAEVEALRRAATEREQGREARRAEQEAHVAAKAEREAARRAAKAERRKAKQAAAMEAAASGTFGDAKEDDDVEVDDADADEDADGADVDVDHTADIAALQPVRPVVTAKKRRRDRGTVSEAVLGATTEAASADVEADADATVNNGGLPMSGAGHAVSETPSVLPVATSSKNRKHKRHSEMSDQQQLDSSVRAHAEGVSPHTATSTGKRKHRS
jgi:ribosome biogenesis protein SSF1/2